MFDKNRRSATSYKSQLDLPSNMYNFKVTPFSRVDAGVSAKSKSTVKLPESVEMSQHKLRKVPSSSEIQIDDQGSSIIDQWHY